MNPLATGKPRNLLEESQKIMIQRTSEVTFTEEEVNQYLNHRLQAEQTGLMAALVKFRGVYIDFSPGFAEVVIAPDNDFEDQSGKVSSSDGLPCRELDSRKNRSGCQKY